MRHVLVGGGYLASNLIKYLEKIVSKDEIKIIGIDENIFFDITKSEDFSKSKEIFTGAIVYIFAAISSEKLVIGKPYLALDTNVVGLANFLSFLAKNCRPAKVIFASSEWVYSNSADNSLVGLGDSYSLYSQQKICGEFIADQFGRIYDIPTLIARFGIIWGRRKTGGACETIAKQCYEASTTDNLVIKVGNAKSARRFVHIDDLSFALSKIAGEVQGVYDITGSEIVTIENIVEVCGAILKKDFVLQNTEQDFSERILQKSQIRPVSYTWQKASFEDRMREHLNEYFLQ